MRLSDCIRSNMELILEGWESFAGSFQPARDMTRTELRDHAKQLLQWISDELDCPQTEAEQTEKSKGRGPQGTKDDAAATHGSGRLEAGFDISEVMGAFRALRASVVRLWNCTKTMADQTDLCDL